MRPAKAVGSPIAPSSRPHASIQPESRSRSTSCFQPSALIRGRRFNSHLRPGTLANDIIDTIAARLLNVIEYEILPLTERAVAASNRSSARRFCANPTCRWCSPKPTTKWIIRCWRWRSAHPQPVLRNCLGRTPHGIWYSISTHEALHDVHVGDHVGRIRQLLLLLQLTRILVTALAIPHDLKILKKVFGLEPGGYRGSNDFWTAYSIADVVDSEPEPECTRLREQQQRIRNRYDELSQQYQNSKDSNDIPLVDPGDAESPLTAVSRA